jgi:hypothetical protein
MEIGESMSSNASRTGLAIVGAAVMAGTTLGLAAPALAAAPEHGTTASVASTNHQWGGDDDRRGGRDWHRGRSWSRGHGWGGGGWGWYNDRDNDRVVGFYRSWQQCQQVGYYGAIRGAWDDFSCDFTGRGLGGWNQFNSFNDWRIGGTWVLRVDDNDF